MSLTFHTVSDYDIEEIKKDPIRFDILHHGEILDLSVLDDLDETEKQNLSEWKPAVKSDIFFVEGMFQSLHYLLTLETAWGKGAFPLNFLTGSRLDIREVGWGKATFYNSNEVKQIANALSELDYSKLRDRYNAAFFNENEIYPRGYKWTQNDGESLLVKLKEIALFIYKAASKNLGIYRVLE